MTDTHTSSSSSQDAHFMDLAFAQAEKSYREGGIPIGAVLVSADGKVLGAGHNCRVQKQSATLHAEMSALEDAGRLAARAYRGATMYTTLSPCNMCTGAVLLYKIGRVVMGENETFVGGEDVLKMKNVELVNLKDDRCKQLMQKYISENQADWDEDIGE
ncbi:Cytosine deaminase [Savitreella phatthalungensis]